VCSHLRGVESWHVAVRAVEEKVCGECEGEGSAEVDIFAGSCWLLLNLHILQRNSSSVL
jgi:hypothetical protein